MPDLQLNHGPLPLPAFLPDATRGVVRSVDALDLEQAGVQALVMNVFHLMQNPGSTTIQALGGLHRMAGWPSPIITDSGGFQIDNKSQFGKILKTSLSILVRILIIAPVVYLESTSIFYEKCKYLDK